MQKYGHRGELPDNNSEMPIWHMEPWNLQIPFWEMQGYYLPRSLIKI